MLIKLSWLQRLKALLLGRVEVDDINADTQPISDNHAANSAADLLSVLQKNGRFVDFMQQNIDHISNEKLGLVVRDIHHGCKKSLQECCNISAILAESENSTVVLKNDFDRHAITLTGNVNSKGDFKGILVHKGWQIDSFNLPTSLNNTSLNIIQPAEVEVQ